MAGRRKRTWTSDGDAKLIEALLKLHESGKYGGADNGFKPGYLKAMQQLLDSHKSAACFRDKSFSQYDSLCKVFGKDRTTGNGAIDLGEEDVIEETQRNSPIDTEGIKDIVGETQPAASVNSQRKRGKTDEKSKTDERSKTDDVES